MIKEAVFLTLILLSLIGCGDKKNNGQTELTSEKPTVPYDLRRTFEHNPNAFTQGLVFDEGKLIESTGTDSSWIAEYDLASGDYEKKVELHPSYFGEGITILNNKLYQLTWRSNTGFVYDANTYKQIGEFKYSFEGWGITHNNKYLIISDGTDKLHYFDPETLTEVFTRDVKHYSGKASNLNELELIEGFIYANQWQTNKVLKIDTSNFKVVRELDFSQFADKAKQINPRADVLNGIAFDPKTEDVYITGKLWPLLFVIRLKE